METPSGVLQPALYPTAQHIRPHAGTANQRSDLQGDPVGLDPGTIDRQGHVLCQPNPC